MRISFQPDETTEEAAPEYVDAENGECPLMEGKMGDRAPPSECTESSADGDPEPITIRPRYITANNTTRSIVADMLI